MFTEMLEGKSVERQLRRLFPEIRFNMKETDKTVELLILVVQFKDRNRGQGNTFMKKLISLSQEQGKSIHLTPDASYSDITGMNQKELKNWYEGLGFKKDPYKEFTHSIKV